MPIRQIRFLSTSLAIALFLGGCGGSRITGDLDELRAAGTLRVVVRPGYLDSTRRSVDGAHEKALLRQLAGRLGLRLEWVKVSRHDAILGALREGRADLATARFSSAAVRREGLQPSAAVDWVEDVFVTGVSSGLDDLDDLDGATLRMHRTAEGWFLHGVAVGDQLHVSHVAEEIPLETVLKRVRTGRYEVTFADSALVQSSGHSDWLRVLAPVAERRPLVWAMRADNPQLRMAVDDFLFAEQVLSRATRTTACRDLEGIRQMRVLRLVTRNSPTTCTVERGGLQGFEYDLALSFARELGVRLELSIPPHGIDPMDWLEQGYGDLAALHEPVAPEDEGRFLVSLPYRRVELMSVVRARSDPPPAWIDDLRGLELVASRPVASLCRNLPVEPSLHFVPLPPGSDGLTALLEVARGSRHGAVVDSDTARLELANRPDLRSGPVLLPNVPLVWVANPSARQLHSRVNSFLARVRRSGLVRQLVANELTSWRPYVPRHLPKVPDGALTPYDEVLKWAGNRYGLDWRLLASLMYEESRFDPYAVGPGGSAGLFQFMPFTWRELGVEDPHHPAEAVEAGAVYLSQLMESFGDLEMPDRVAMALASYNVGPRHVYDARRLAEEMGFDPNRWARNVETAMVVIDDPEVARRFPAGVCRCRRAVGYTRRILRRYAAYTEQFAPR